MTGLGPLRSSAPTSSRHEDRLEFLGNTHGATAVEYGLVAALISVAILGSLTQTASPVTRLFNVILSGVSRLN